MKKLMTVVVSALCAVVAFDAFAAEKTLTAEMLANGITLEGGDTLIVPEGEWAFAAGSILVAEGAESVVIRGSGAAKSTISVAASMDGKVHGAVVSAKGAVNLSVEGIRFKDCFNYSAISPVYGGAIDLDCCTNVTVSACAFRDCFAVSRGPTEAQVIGGIACEKSSANGGAVACRHCAGLIFADCDFRCNLAEHYPRSGTDAVTSAGGAVYCNDSNGKVSDCVFVGNSVAISMKGSPSGGAFYSTFVNKTANNCTFDMTNCLFVANTTLSSCLLTGTRRGFPLLCVADSQSNLENEVAGCGTVMGARLNLYDCTVAGNFTQALRTLRYVEWKPINIYRSIVWDVCGVSENYYGLSFYAYDSDICQNTGVKTGTILTDPELGRDLVPQAAAASAWGWRPSAWAPRTVNVRPGDGSLSAAFADARDGDTIVLAEGTYGSGETFPLKLDGVYSVRVIGAGQGASVIDAGGKGVAKTRVLDLRNSGYVTFEDLTVTGGCEYMTTNGIAIVAEVLAGGEQAITNSYYQIFGGGVYAYNCSKLTFDRVAVTGNRAYTEYKSSADWGGGAARGGGCCFVASDVEMTACDVADNVLDFLLDSVSAYGAGMAVQSARVVADRCRIANNQIKGDKKYAQGAVYGGGIYQRDALHKSTFRNCLIVSNRQVSANNLLGGGICLYGSYLENCTIAHNGYFASGATVAGSGVYDYPCNGANWTWGAVTNCIITGHGQDIYGGTGYGMKIGYTSYLTTGGSAVTSIADPEAAHCITDDAAPFARKSYKLNKASKVVDRAWTSYSWLTRANVDFYGQRRVYGAGPDFGCAECVPTGLMLMVK